MFRLYKSIMQAFFEDEGTGFWDIFWVLFLVGFIFFCIKVRYF